MAIKDTTVKKCGCVYFELGDPVLCLKHRVKVEKKERKEKRDEERGLRRAAAEQAATLGHELNRFTEYGAADQPGKWTAFCERCGNIVIVYDRMEQAPGDQVVGKPLTQECRRSSLMKLDAVKEVE